MNSDEIKYSLQNIKFRKLRSSLSVLSVLIGIAAIFAIISFGLGIQSYIDGLAEEAGVDKLFIQAESAGAPGTDPNFFLSKEDENFVSKINGIREVVGIYTAVGQIEDKDESNLAFVSGMQIGKLDLIEEASTLKLDTGRRLKKGDKDKLVLGYNYQINNKIFSKGLSVGDKVDLNGEKFKIVGFYQELGNPGDDSNIYITSEKFEEIYPDREGKYGFIMISANKGIDTSEFAKKIEDKLRKFKGQEKGKEDFFVQSFEDALETFSNIIGVLNGVLILIAFVSVIISIVNIMNTMYTAILERTNEIGVMKAIGARNNSILGIFIFESGVLALIGGILGVILGYIAASIGGQVAANAGFSLLKPIFPSFLIIGCLTFSFLIGSLAGLLPARQASRLKPVDALRYE